ncbi:MAG: CBS domain-containing protein, partial [Actinomycetota bacterium]
MEIGPLVNQPVVSVGPEHTLLDVASMMCDQKVGSAIVHTDEGYPGIITERDLLRAIARGADLSKARVEEFMT